MGCAGSDSSAYSTAICSSGNGWSMYADLYLPRWLGPEPSSSWVAYSHGRRRGLIVGVALPWKPTRPRGATAAGASPASIACLNSSSRYGSSPTYCAASVIWPLARWKRCSSPNRPEYGLPTSLLTARNSP